MNNTLFKALFLALVVLSGACSASPPDSKMISISGNIEIPLPLESNKYWIDDGPLFVASKNPLVTYRVIKKEEITFAGSDKSVHEFIRSSFDDPEGVSEKSFLSSHKGYNINHNNRNDLSIYILDKENKAKAYIVSGSMNSGVEISVTGPNSFSIMDQIINGVTLTKGE